MSIATRCPHCDKAYRLKDELRGKRVACTNPNCKKVFTVQAVPAAAADRNGPARPAGNVEEMALAMLADEAKSEEKAPEAAATATIRVKCQFCDHENVFDARLAGKNTPCRNEECRKIIKVPLPRKDDPKDWRAVQKRPTAAKVDAPEMEGAWGNVQTTAVSREALLGAEAVAEEEREPRTWGQLIKIGLAAGAFLLILVTGAVWTMSRMRQGKQERAMEQALAFVGGDPKAPGKLKKEQAGLIHLLAGEYDLARNNAAEAKNKLVAARGELDQSGGNTPERCAALIELARAQAQLAGSKEQVDKGERLDWGKVNSEVGATLRRLPSAAGEEARDMRAHAFRRLTRVLAGTGNAKATAALAYSVTPGEEQAEILAVIGLELLALGERDEAKSVATRASAGQPTNAASLIALWLALGAPDATPEEQKVAAEKARAVAPPPGGDTAVKPVARIGYAEGLARQGRIDDGRKIAAASGKPEERLRALAAVAGAVVPTRRGDATDLEQCAKLLESELKGKPVSSWLLLRLTHLALQAENHNLAARFAGAIPDAGLRSWARFEILRNRLQAGGDAGAEAVDEVGEPGRLAHWLAWAEVARHKAAAAGPGAAVAEVKTWEPEAKQAFGYAGVALAEK